MPHGIMHKLRQILTRAALAAAVLGLERSEALAQACAMCRSAVQSADDPLARGINLSVALMVAAPFAVVGSIGGWLVYAYARARRQGALPAPAGAGGPGAGIIAEAGPGPAPRANSQTDSEDRT